MIYYPERQVEIRDIIVPEENYYSWRKVEPAGDNLPTIMKIQFKNKDQWQNLANALDDMYEFIAIETYDACSNETITLVQILDFKDSLKEVGETDRTQAESTLDEKEDSETTNSSE